ncbi:MAG: flagellar basal body-associated FliL family protein [Rhodospirillales bacterium]|nr:flagellar basal body-associated FliL family protein [Rhodospirillales bacterium]
MAEDEDAEDAEDAEGEEKGADDEDDEEGAPRKSGKGKLLIIIGVALLLVIGGAAAAYFTGLLDPLIEMAGGGGGEEGDEQPVDLGEAIFFDLPELLVNLNTTGRKSVFLKIRISLELRNPDDVPTIEDMMPRIIDNFQVYLRELRIDDLKGSAGMYRLRQELLTRVATAAAPAKVSDVLFKEMLIQ